MAQASLTARSLAKLEAELESLGTQQVAASPPLDVDHTLAPLDDLQRLQAAELSAARREHLQALQREYDQLVKLSADEASNWSQRREARAACTLQSAWRRRSVRSVFMRAIGHVTKRNRENAVVIIQRAQRTRRRIVDEAAPPISQSTVAELSSKIAKRTLEMAEELSKRVELREAWRAAAVTGTETDAPTLPKWLEDPAWKQERRPARPLHQVQPVLSAPP